MNAKHLIVMLLAGLVALSVAPAMAEPPEQAARRLLKQGRSLLVKGDYGQAVIVLMKAQGTFPSAEIQVEIAAAYEGLGSPVDAAELYERLLADEGLFGKDRERCEQRLEALRAQLGRLTITCRIKEALVKVNDREVGKTPLPHPVYVEPGDVTIVVQNPAHRVTQDHTVAAGEHKKIKVSLRDRPRPQSQPSAATPGMDLPPPTAALPPTAARKPAARTGPAPRRRDGAGKGWLLGRRWTWVVAGGAVVAGAVGMGLGISASGEYGEYKEAETSVSRYPELEDSIRTKSIAANAMFGVAGGLAVTAAVLFFVEGHLAGRAERRASAPRWWAGPGAGGQLNVGGRF